MEHHKKLLIERPQASISLAGLSIISAALTFWIAWFLMPDQGTADTLHILSIVSKSRNAVLASTVVQIVSSVLYITALFYLAKGLPFISSMAFAGMVLLGIGAMGMCVDAFFHLLAYFMTDTAVALDAGVVRVMELMQTQGIMLLLPLLLSFFVGSLLLPIGLYRQRLTSVVPVAVITSAFAIGIVGAIVVNKVLGYGRPVLVLSILALFALTHTIIGKELLHRPRNAETLY